MAQALWPAAWFWFLKILKRELLCVVVIPPLGIYLKVLKERSGAYVWTPLFTVELLTIAPKCPYPESSLVGGWIQWKCGIYIQGNIIQPYKGRKHVWYGMDTS